jgi:gamma-glutamyltranspeptidase/glutathione hydrolase
MDGERNVFCGTPSGWGSDVPMGDTGVVLGTRLVSFWPEAGHPNEARGGKRPRITLTPTIVLKNGEPFLAISVAGGDKQDQVALNILLNVVEFGMNPQEAAESPRVSTLHHTDSFNPGGIMGEGVLEIEEGVPGETIRELEGMGYRVRRGFSAMPSVILNKPEEGVVQVGAREAHPGARAW